MANPALRLLVKPEYQMKPSSDSMVRQRRLCLHCKVAFDSAWAGERVCPRCKGTTAWRNGASIEAGNFSQSSSRSGRKGSS